MASVAVPPPQREGDRRDDRSSVSPSQACCTAGGSLTVPNALSRAVKPIPPGRTAAWRIRAPLEVDLPREREVAAELQAERAEIGIEP